MRKLGLFIRLLGESALFALQALLLNKLRTFLSILGITIGIFSVILVLSITNSLEKNIKESINSLGTDVVYIQKWPWGADDGGEYKWWKFMNRPVPKVKEMQGLQKSFTGNAAAGAIAFMYTAQQSTVKFLDNNVSDVSTLAVSHDYSLINNFEMEQGRYFSEFESKSGAPVVILGYEIYVGLFGNAAPIDKEIVVRGRKMRVIGVVKKQGESIIETGLDEVVLVPINWLQRVMTLATDRGNPMIMVKAGEGISVDALENELKGKMRAVRKLKPGEEDNFALNRITMISKQLNGLFWSVNVGGFIIGIFSVLVGGFGIANIMFVSVKERTGQIGIQKAVGARNTFILIQFLTEAVVLCLFGGLLGILLVFLATQLATRLFEFNLFLSMGNFLLGTSLSVGIGMLSGFIPAWNASRLDPVEAIRTKI